MSKVHVLGIAFIKFFVCFHSLKYRLHMVFVCNSAIFVVIVMSFMFN